DGPHPRKPDPAGLRAMMQAANTEPEQTMLVGDSAIDLETTRRAETSCCLVSYGFGFRRELLDRKEPGLVFAASAAELKAAIDAFLSS
ncbi:MAG TPA: HAD hydrolase-like protein, partial [Vicinamibacterales bacterium]|nr:HAD hydrolase-like protein [Vicinamibacterales bacterium]